MHLASSCRSLVIRWPFPQALCNICNESALLQWCEIASHAPRWDDNPDAFKIFHAEELSHARDLACRHSGLVHDAAIHRVGGPHISGESFLLSGDIGTPRRTVRGWAFHHELAHFEADSMLPSTLQAFQGIRHADSVVDLCDAAHGRKGHLAREGETARHEQPIARLLAQCCRLANFLLLKDRISGIALLSRQHQQVAGGSWNSGVDHPVFPTLLLLGGSLRHLRRTEGSQKVTCRMLRKPALSPRPPEAPCSR